MNLPVAEAIHPQSNKSPVGVKTKAMVESKRNESVAKDYSKHLI